MRTGSLRSVTSGLHSARPSEEPGTDSHNDWYINWGQVITAEVRNGSAPYNLSYTYDKGGNRLTKTDALNNRRTIYTYDRTDPSLYGSDNNRLMKFEVYYTLPNPDVKLSTTWHYYFVGFGQSGNPERIVSRNESAPTQYSATRFKYAANARTVTYVTTEQWTWSGVAGQCPTGYSMTAGREFRYDQGRARYMQRNLLTPFTSTWTDYDGESPYGDYTVSGSTVTNGSRYEPGVWNTEGSSAQYLHSDHLGTLRMTTTASGAAGIHRVFTAFGERIDTTPVNRFGYVGAHGYQAHTEFPFLHVGARYYDPSSGRFLQRDPIGIRGGLNVYVYASNAPVRYVDPLGLSVEIGRMVAHGVGSVVGGVIGYLYGAAFCGPIGAAAGGAGGASVGYDIGDNVYDAIFNPPPPGPPPPPVNIPPVIFIRDPGRGA